MRRRLSPQAVCTLLVVAGASLFVLSQLQPSLLLANTTPAGGDMGAHVWAPAYLRDHLLPHGRLTGWTPDWYAGFPALQFYFPLPSLLIVLLDVVLPYAVAFKLVSVSGLITLPVAAWAFGRLSGMRFPGPAMLAVATVPFLFERAFTIYGGNIPSTLAGEFAFSISLSVGLVFLGVYARGLETGKHRALAAALLAITCLCHVVPLFFVAFGAIVLTLMRLDRARLRFAIPTMITGSLLAAFWVVPFVLRAAYTNDMGWEKIVTYRKDLVPQDLKGLLLLAGAGAIASVLLRRRTGVFLTIMALASGAAFILAPQSRLWNARLLPFWFFCLYLLAGLAILEAAGGLALAARRVRPSLAALPAGSYVLLAVLATAAAWIVAGARTWKGDAQFGLYVGLFLLAWLGLSALMFIVWKLRPDAPDALVDLATPVAALFIAAAIVALPLGALPKWAPLKTDDRSFIPDWVKWNYTGYERKAAYPEYRDVIATMTRVAEKSGCGRAMWEYEPELDRHGTPMSLMLLPYWTNGCIGSMEGLFFESSATTPYHFLNQSELSFRPSRPQRDLPYRELDVTRGIEHLQLLGVRYYLALTAEAQAQADVNPDLRLVDTSKAWDATYTENNASVTKKRTWRVYEVAGSATVAPLRYQPAVLTNVPKGGRKWQDAAVAWYQDPTKLEVPLAASGPSSWARIKSTQAAPRKPLRDVRVSRIRSTDDRIEFDVDRVGVPVLVKTSYFPSWQARGADGPWRVTPNLMVVIPTSRHVSIHYGYTPVDWLAYALALLGLVSLVVLARRGPVEYPVVAEQANEADGDEDLMAEYYRQLAGNGPAEQAPDAAPPPETAPAAPSDEPVSVPTSQEP